MRELFRKHVFLASAVGALLLVLALGTLKLAMAAVAPGGQSPGGGPAGYAGGGAAGRATPVTVVAATERSFTDQVEVLGVAKGLQSVTLTSNASELITAVRFKDGQHVDKNQVLVDLKSKEEGAGVAQADAALVLAKLNYDRYAKLGEQGFAPRAMVEQYRAALDQAKANLAAAQSRVGDRTIRAPFAGVVGLTDIAPGALITPGTPIATLDDVSVVRVDFDVPDRYLSFLKEGAPIIARSDTYKDQTIAGKIAKIDSRIDVNTRAIKARAEFPNPEGSLKPGMLMHVQLAHDSRQAVAAPESAVQFVSDQPYVYLIAQRRGETIAEQRGVTVGVRQSGFIEVKQGLAAGDKIVADGLDRIQPNQPVRPTETGEDRRQAGRDAAPMGHPGRAALQ